jgi:hypothetical protein
LAELRRASVIGHPVIGDRKYNPAEASVLSKFRLTDGFSKN